MSDVTPSTAAGRRLVEAIFGIEAHSLDMLADPGAAICAIEREATASLTAENDCRRSTTTPPSPSFDYNSALAQLEQVTRSRDGWERDAHTYAVSRGCQQEMNLAEKARHEAERLSLTAQLDSESMERADAEAERDMMSADVMLLEAQLEQERAKVAALVETCWNEHVAAAGSDHLCDGRCDWLEAVSRISQVWSRRSKPHRRPPSSQG
jgi:hypothetical protein